MRGKRCAVAVAGATAGLALAATTGWVIVGNAAGDTPATRARSAATGAPQAATGAPQAATGGPAATGSGPAAPLAEDELLRRASERLIARCMARHGFAYAEQPPPSPADRDFRYVLDDVGWAREYGYGTMAGGAGAWDRDVNAAALARLSPERQRAWQRTLMGSGRQLTVDLPDLGRVSGPDNGCTADARRTLYRDLPGWYRVRRIVDHFGSYTAGRVTGAPEYRAGLDAWAACVRGRGYPASSPRELRELVTPRTPGPAGGRASTREVAAAETEAGCAVTTGFSRTIGALEDRYRPEVERRFAREIETLESFQREAIPRARQILADA